MHGARRRTAQIQGWRKFACSPDVVSSNELGIRYFFLWALCLASLGLGSAQSVITTFAGTDANFTGDGQPALNAGLGLMTGIAVDRR